MLSLQSDQHERHLEDDELTYTNTITHSFYSSIVQSQGVKWKT